MAKRIRYIQGIPPFTGAAAQALWDYIENTHVNPEAQAKVDAAIRRSAAKCVEG